LINVVGFAWTLKFLWSPLVDVAGTYKRWISGAVFVIAMSLAGMAVMSDVGPALSRPGPTESRTYIYTPSTTFYALLVLLALGSATQDIAVDAFTIRNTPPKLLGPINSIRVTAYRIALTAPGLLAWVAQNAGWPHAFATAAIAAGLLGVLEALLDTRLAVVEHGRDGLEREGPDDHEEHEEVGRRDDHLEEVHLERRICGEPGDLLRGAAREGKGSHDSLRTRPVT